MEQLCMEDLVKRLLFFSFTHTMHGPTLFYLSPGSIHDFAAQAL